jgi:hypothetical protein
MLSLTQQQYEEEIKRIKTDKLRLLEKKKQYEQGNRLEFFKPPPKDWKPDPDKRAYCHNPPQKKLLKAWANPKYKTFVFYAANRTGKTEIAVAIGFSSMFGFWPWDELQTPISEPPIKVLLVGQRWEEHIKKFLIPKMKALWPKNRPLKTSKNNVGVESEWVDITTGSVLHIMSNMQDSDAFEGSDYDIVLYDEPPRQEVRDAIRRGLIDRGGRELFTCTLLKEPWVDRDVVKARLDDGRPDRSVFSVHAEMQDNVGYGLLQKDVDAYKFQYRNRPELIQERVYGIPSYMGGLVLPKLKREIHLKERFDIPTDWLVDIEIDVHPRERQAVLFIATSPKNERYLCDEIWMHGDGTAIGHAIIKRIIYRGYRRINYIEIDPLAKSDSNNPDTTRGKIDKVLGKFAYDNQWVKPQYPTNTKADEGVFCVGIATKDKDSGILSINDHLKGPNNKPSIWIFDDLARTIYEAEGWMYDEDTQKPLKKDDHMMECWYRAMLLNTTWYEPEEHDDEDQVQPKSTANKYTGY